MTRMKEETMSWNTDIVLTAGAVDESTTEHLIEVGMDQGAVVAFPQTAPGPGEQARYTVSLGVDGETLDEAMEHARRLAQRFAEVHESVAVASVTVLTTSEREYELQRPVYQELVNQADIGARIGRSRARVHKMAQEPSFPRPAVVTGSVTLWVWAEVQKWVTEHRRSPGRPRKENP